MLSQEARAFVVLGRISVRLEGGGTRTFRARDDSTHGLWPAPGQGREHSVTVGLVAGGRGHEEPLRLEPVHVTREGLPGSVGVGSRGAGGDLL